MEENYIIFNRFQTTLEHSSSSKRLSIYEKNEATVVKNLERHYTSKDVLTNITKQLDDLQTADSSKKLSVRNNLTGYKKSMLMPVNLLSLEKNQPECNHEKFETQCVSDTQLINIVEDAEKVVHPNGITQEFENSFCEQHIALDKETKNSCLDTSKKNKNDASHFGSSSTNFSGTSNCYKKLDEENIYESKRLKQEQKDDEIVNIAENNTDQTESNRPISPIINYVKPLTLRNSLSPLIYTLDAFENFETLAFPIVENNSDMDAAKHLINSQIVDKELYLGGHIKSIHNKGKRSPSPVLSIRQKRRFSSNSPKSAIDTIKNVSLKVPDKILLENNSQSMDMEINKYFEDEILFSSDEEDIKEVNYQDLPLTCALETSFSSEHNILDKTMYVGFQTASNKSIQITTESFSKAQSVLENLEPTLAELVVMYNKKSNFSCTDNKLDISIPNNQLSQDSSSKASIKCKDFETKIEPTLKDRLTIKNVKNTEGEILVAFGKDSKNHSSDRIRKLENDSTNKDCVPVFHTASKKRIKLSENAVAKCQQVFKDIDLDDKFDETSLKNIKVKEQVQNPSFIQGKDEEQCTKDTFNLLALPIAPKVHTNLKEISEQVQLDDQNIIQEFENDLMDSNIEKNEVGMANLKSNENNNQLNCELTPDTVNKKPCHSEHLDKFIQQPRIDFKTASNKHIKISECAFIKTKFILNDFDLSNNFENKEDIDKTPEQNKIEHNQPNILNKPTNSQFSQDKLHLSDSLHINKNSECIKSSPLCQTANSKPVTVSSNALIKRKKIIDDIKSHISENPIESGNEVKNSKFDGFKTANNKPITVSNSALSNVRNFFADILTSDDNGNNISPNEKDYYNIHDFKEVSQTSENYLNICDKKSSLKSDVNNEDHQKKFLQTFQGFRTASNKNVKISDEALAKSKQLFLELDLNKEVEHTEIQNLPVEEFKGFQTANNKRIKVSSQSLAKSKLLFQDLDDNNEKICLKNQKTHKNLQNIDQCLNQVKNTISHEGNISSKLENAHKNVFAGFQTASNKQVQVSDQALALSKQILQDLESVDFKKPEEIINEKNKKAKSIVDLNKEHNGCQSAKNMNFNLLFKTGNNRDVKVTEEALIESKKTLDPNRNNEGKTSQTAPKQLQMHGEDKMNVDNLFDSEVLNNFEVTMYTEDFHKDTKHDKSKRSGSPILMCRAKKRKFEVPCKKSAKPVNPEPNKIITKANITTSFNFDGNYKKNKKYNLIDLKNMEKLDTIKHAVDSYIVNFNYENCLDFEFHRERNELSDGKWTTEDLKKYFISLVNKKLIPDGWLENHLRSIIFKLISYEKEFLNTMSGICSVKNVLEQLKYRFDRELYNVERPIIRKLLEKDDICTKTMILRVVEIYVDGARMISEMSTSNIELLLSDGWYCIKVCLDQMLVKLVKEKKITVGTKLAIHGAEMVNCDQGLAPWEDTSRVRLKLSGNSTRRAFWHARLGRFPAGAISTPLSHVQLDGGRVSRTRAFVTRVYPTVYVEKFDDGSTVTRSERLEHLFQIKYESERQALLEKIYEEVEKEFTDQESQDSEYDTQSREGLDTGSQINRLMLQSKDPVEFRANLTRSQCHLLQDYSSRRREKLLQTVQTRIEERLKAKGPHLGRNVVPVMKIRLADVGSNGDVTKAMMSIWRPNDAIQEIIKEGMWIDLFNIVPTAVRFSEIQFSAGRQTIFNRSKYKESDKIQHMTSRLKRTCYSIKELVQNPAMATDCNEVDTAGIIFLIDPSIAQFESIKGQLFQNVYFADEEKNIVCVNFWGGLKKFGYENVLDTGQVLACMNLQKRAGNTRKSIPQFRATEYSFFTKTPKFENARKAVDVLNRKISRDFKKFCEECISKKNSYSVFKYGNSENISPYRINYSDYNISKHKSYIHSSLTRNTNNSDDIFNLSGLDFESTFKQTDTQDLSPSAILRKKKVNEKIARLKMYGEPPPITPIHIINKSNNATSAFKSPLSSNNDVSNIANEKKQQSCSTHHNSSPITYSKNTSKGYYGNPIKLNFSNNISKEDCGENKIVDPFAEEFDASPPLSLD